MQQAGFGLADAGEFGMDDFFGTGAADGQPHHPTFAETFNFTQEELDALTPSEREAVGMEDLGGDDAGAGAEDGTHIQQENENGTVTNENGNNLDGDAGDVQNYIEANTDLPPEPPIVEEDEGLFREFNEIPQRILDRAVQREVSSRFEDALDTVLGQDDPAEPEVDTEFALPDDAEVTGSQVIGGLGDEGWTEPHTSVEATKYNEMAEVEMQEFSPPENRLLSEEAAYLAAQEIRRDVGAREIRDDIRGLEDAHGEGAVEDVIGGNQSLWTKIKQKYRWLKRQIRSSFPDGSEPTPWRPSCKNSRTG